MHALVETISRVKMSRATEPRRSPHRGRPRRSTYVAPRDGILVRGLR